MRSDNLHTFTLLIEEVLEEDIQRGKRNLARLTQAERSDLPITVKVFEERVRVLEEAKAWFASFSQELIQIEPEGEEFTLEEEEVHPFLRSIAFFLSRHKQHIEKMANERGDLLCMAILLKANEPQGGFPLTLADLAKVYAACMGHGWPPLNLEIEEEENGR